jgi:hypothetical protein
MSNPIQTRRERTLLRRSITQALLLGALEPYGTAALPGRRLVPRQGTSPTLGEVLRLEVAPCS